MSSNLPGHPFCFSLSEDRLSLFLREERQHLNSNHPGRKALKFESKSLRKGLIGLFNLGESVFCVLVQIVLSIFSPFLLVPHLGTLSRSSVSLPLFFSFLLVTADNVDVSVSVDSHRL